MPTEPPLLEEPVALQPSRLQHSHTGCLLSSDHTFITPSTDNPVKAL